MEEKKKVPVRLLGCARCGLFRSLKCGTNRKPGGIRSGKRQRWRDSSAWLASVVISKEWSNRQRRLAL